MISSSVVSLLTFAPENGLSIESVSTEIGAGVVAAEEIADGPRGGDGDWDGELRDGDIEGDDCDGDTVLLKERFLGVPTAMEFFLFR